MISDEHLEYWGARFVARGYRRYMTLEQFMRDACGIAARIEGGQPPMLERQRAVQQRIDRDAIEVAALPRHTTLRDGRLIEPLRHHAWECARRPESRRAGGGS